MAEVHPAAPSFHPVSCLFASTGESAAGWGPGQECALCCLGSVCAEGCLVPVHCVQSARVLRYTKAAMLGPRAAVLLLALCSCEYEALGLLALWHPVLLQCLLCFVAPCPKTTGVLSTKKGSGPTGCIATINPAQSVKENSINVISYDELKKVMATGGAQIFDVRTPEEVANGKIPTSVNIPVGEMEQALKMDPATFKKKYLVNKPQPEDNIIVYCQTGKRSARAAEIAMAQGFASVRSYAGGYKEWSEKEKHCNGRTHPVPS